MLWGIEDEDPSFVELETGHVKLISDELECGNCRNMTPETVARLRMEVQRQEGGGSVASLLRSRERFICKDPKSLIFPCQAEPGHTHTHS